MMNDNEAINMTNHASTGVGTLLDWLFGSSKDRKLHWTDIAWLAGLFLGGAALWSVFLHQGQLGFNYRDWFDIAGPRLTFLKDALLHGVLPLHISHPSTLGGVTDRYLSIPDTFLAPQAILLLWMDIGPFVLVNQILMYALGFVGLLWIRRRYGLSLFSFSVMFLLFNFNGHILSHYAIGHITWGGYFLFPWFAMLVLSLLDGDRSWGWVAKMSALLLLIWLNGSFHQFVWLILFLALLALATWKHALTLLKAIGFSLLLGLVRILPVAIISGSLHQAYDFYGGYLSLGYVWDSLVEINPPFHDSFGSVPTQMWWEVSLYVGIIGAVFLLFFGVIRWAQNREESRAYHALALPMLGLALFSIGSLYRFVLLLQIPLIDGERVTSRMLSVPFFFVLLLAAIELQRWLNQPRVSPVAALVGGFLALVEANDLWKNFSLWKVDTAIRAFEVHPFDPLAWFAVNRPDPAYTQTLGWGAAGTLLGVLTLALLVSLERRGVLRRLAENLLRRGEGSAPSAGSRLRAFLAAVIAPEARDDVERIAVGAAREPPCQS
jgi:hypothetical protein